MVVNSSSAKLMVSGSSAEQPRPASAKATMPRYGWLVGRKEMAKKAIATMKGKTSQVRRSGNHFSIAAKRIRPAVTVPQNVVSASDATVGLAPSFFVMYRDAQLPFIVS